MISQNLSKYLILEVPECFAPKLSVYFDELIIIQFKKHTSPLYN